MFRRTRTYRPELREQARQLRREGHTYPEIIAQLGTDVPEATLSGWVRDIELTIEQRQRIKQLEVEGARKAQPLGALWNRQQKEKRLQLAQTEADPIAKQLAHDKQALQLMAAALYMGEGAKGANQFSFCNSDPQVIKTWMALLRGNFEIDESKFRCQLTISTGMDEQMLKNYWSGITQIPLTQFIRSTVDKRQSKKPREGYRGVCKVNYYSSAIRRYLDALAQGVMQEILES